jgi:hypothetical protein
MTPHLARTITLWALIVLGGGLALLLLISALSGRLRHHYGHHFRESRRERLFLSSVAFFLTFGIVRLITHSIHAGRGPFRDIYAGDLHIHHLVWGILLLLIIGYLWLAQIGTGCAPGSSVWAGRVTSILYGFGAALTLDEFALWFRLQDVYWSPEGRASVEVAFLFGAILSIGVWGGRFMHAMFMDVLRLGSVGKSQQGSLGP